jgi:hypothetical protein
LPGNILKEGGHIIDRDIFTPEDIELASIGIMQSADSQAPLSIWVPIWHGDQWGKNKDKVDMKHEWVECLKGMWC